MFLSFLLDIVTLFVLLSGAVKDTLVWVIPTSTAVPMYFFPSNENRTCCIATGFFILRTYT